MKKERGVNVNRRDAGDDDNRLPDWESRILALNEMQKASGESSILEMDSERGLACILWGVFGKPWFSLFWRMSVPIFAARKAMNFKNCR
jgi:hypothetical protein